MLEDLATAFSLLGNGIDGLYLLLDILAPVLLFGAVVCVSLWFFWQVAREFWQSRSERQKALEQFRRALLQSIWNILFVVGFTVFFGSLFLSSLGVRTWWK